MHSFVKGTDTLDASFCVMIVPYQSTEFKLMKKKDLEIPIESGKVDESYV